jgi:hypothetical protein
MIDGNIVALARSGHEARSSPYSLHHLFADWVEAQCEVDRFAELKEGERLVGEWLALAHGTIYYITDDEPFTLFDLMRGAERATYDELHRRFGGDFKMPVLLSRGAISMPVSVAMEAQRSYRPESEIEGVIYRVEREGRVDFLAKYVKPDFVPGRYLQLQSEFLVWNWRPAHGPHGSPRLFVGGLWHGVWAIPTGSLMRTSSGEPRKPLYQCIINGQDRYAMRTLVDSDGVSIPAMVLSSLSGLEATMMAETCDPWPAYRIH